MPSWTSKGPISLGGGVSAPSKPGEEVIFEIPEFIVNVLQQPDKYSSERRFLTHISSIK